MSNFTVDMSQVKQLARDLKAVDPVLQKEFLTGLSVAGDVVAQQAKRNASFSTRIPATIRARRRGLSVRVQAGGDAAPHAAPLEHGGFPGTFRHPVFGNRAVWVDQPAHPFLAPAADEAGPEVEAVVVKAVDLALARLRL